MVCYFISGPMVATNLTNYIPELEVALSQPDSTFVVGDARGIDKLAQEYLALILPTAEHHRVTVFHMGDAPRYYLGHFNLHGGFISDETRDVAMTLASQVDIAHPEDKNVVKARLKQRYREDHISGTQANLLRRAKLRNLSSWLGLVKGN